MEAPERQGAERKYPPPRWIGDGEVVTDEGSPDPSATGNPPPRTPGQRGKASSVRQKDSENKISSKRKAPPHAWKPGQSGNPGGRPKSVKAVQELAATFTEEAIHALVDTMRKTQDPKTWDPKETRQAAIAILNRACGMPSQPVTGSNGQPIENEFPDLMSALRKLAGEAG